MPDFLHLFLFFAALLGSSLFIQALVFKKKTSSHTADLERLSRAVKDQENSAKMLIRRDLELTRANEKLHELDQAKSNFISIVAHQLRTPLSGVKWTLNMVLSGTLGQISNEQRSFLMKCYESN